jgi:hypothetical protein
MPNQIDFAFPSPAAGSTQNGLSKIEYFASQALMGMLAHDGRPMDNPGAISKFTDVAIKLGTDMASKFE